MESEYSFWCHFKDNTAEDLGEKKRFSEVISYEVQSNYLELLSRTKWCPSARFNAQFALNDLSANCILKITKTRWKSLLKEKICHKVQWKQIIQQTVRCVDKLTFLMVEYINQI